MKDSNAKEFDNGQVAGMSYVDLSGAEEEFLNKPGGKELFESIANKLQLKRPSNGIQSIEEFLSKKYDFRKNPVLDRTEFKTKSEAKYQLLDERSINSLFRVLNHSGIRCNILVLRSILNSDFVSICDPFKKYFESLSAEFDPNRDYIDELASTVTTTNQGFWKESFKKWIVASVGCAIDPNVVNQQVLVLSGKQGIGKTTWLNSLLPERLKGYLFVGTVDPGNKDTLVCLSENFLLNLDELENLNKTELGNLKSLVTQKYIKVRRPYGQFNENIERRASFMGSVNEAEFLNDTTGNRRFLCFTATKIEYNHSVPLDKVYAQAYNLLKGDFEYWFAGKDIKKIEENNDTYLSIDLEEELVLKYFEVPKSKDEVQLFTPLQIISYIIKKEKNSGIDMISAKKLGSILKKHEFKKISKKKAKPYKVKLLELSSTDIHKYTNDDEITDEFETNSLKVGSSETILNSVEITTEYQLEPTFTCVNKSLNLYGSPILLRNLNDMAFGKQYIIELISKNGNIVILVLKNTTERFILLDFHIIKEDIDDEGRNKLRRIFDASLFEKKDFRTRSDMQEIFEKFNVYLKEG